MGAEVAVELDTSGVVSGLKDLNKTSKESGAVFREAFMGDIVGQGLDKLKSHLSGVAAQAVDAASSLAKGFLAGGPVGLGIAALGVGVGLVADHFTNTEKAAAAAAAVIKTDFDKAKTTIATFVGELVAANTKIDAIAKARAGGITIAEAMGGISVESAAQNLARAKQFAGDTADLIAAARARLVHEKGLELATGISAHQAAVDADVAEIERLKANIPKEKALVEAAEIQLEAAKATVKGAAEEKALAAKTAADDKAAAAAEKAAADRVAAAKKRAEDAIGARIDAMTDGAKREQSALDKIAANALAVRDEEDAAFFDGVDKKNATAKSAAEKTAEDEAFFRQSSLDDRMAKSAEETRVEAMNAAEREQIRLDEQAHTVAVAEATHAAIGEFARFGFGVVTSAASEAIQSYAMFSRAQEQVAAATNMTAEETAAAEDAKKQAILAGLAEQAFGQAAFKAAEAVGYVASGNIPSAIAAGTSAAMFGAIAGGSAVAANTIGNERGNTRAENEAVDAAKKKRDSGSGGNARGSRSGSKEGGGVTVVISGGGIYTTTADVSRGIARGVREAQRLA